MGTPEHHPATARQLEVHAFMLAHQLEHIAPPTLREITDHFEFASTYSVTCHLRALETKGLARHRKNCSRGWIAIKAHR